MSFCYIISVMKKIVMILLVILTLLPAFSASKKLYDEKSYEYQTIRKLSILSGVLGPSPVFPMTEDELEIAYERIDEHNLSGRNHKEYEELGEIFVDNEKKLDLVVDLNPSLSYTTLWRELSNKDFIRPYQDIPAFFNYGIRSSFFDNAYIELIHDHGNEDYVYDYGDRLLSESGNNNGIHLTSFEWGYSFRGENGKPGPEFGLWPSIARAAVGTKGFSAIMGRTRQSFGSGITGNLLMDDNFRYQEALSLAFYNGELSYRLSLTTFDTQDSDGIINPVNFTDLQNIRVIHRGEISAFDKFRAALNFSVMMYVPNGLDIRYFVPLMMVHSWYNMEESIQLKDDVYDEANNAFGVELETVVLPGLAINAQVLVDQIATKAEGDNPVVPNAYGFLANVSYLKSFAPFDAEFYVEGYYSYPSLYLNKKLNPDGTKNWNYDWIVGYRRDDYYGDIDYSGHRYGPDTKMLLAGLELAFTEIGLKTRHEFEYKITGEMDKFDSEYEFKVMTPTGIPETRLSYRSFNEYMPMDNLKLNLDYELGLWINYAHKEGHNRFIPQIHFGVSWVII